MTVCAQTYERLLARVEKPGRYLGNELGCVRKSPDAVAVRVALAFPEVYEIAQSHPGLQLLYDLLNRREDVYAERVYAPWFDLEAMLREHAPPARLAGDVHAAARVPHRRLQPAVRADLHQHPGHARSRRGPAARRGARCGAIRWSSPAVRAPSTPSRWPTSWTPSCSATARRRLARSATSIGAGTGATVPRCSRRLAQVRGVYVPALYAPQYSESGRLVAIDPRACGAPAGGREAHPARPRYACRSPTPTWCPTSRSCTGGRASR